MRKALVVGFGSIGQRHAEILEGLGVNVAVVSRRTISHPQPFWTVSDALHNFKPDYVIVASKTNEHYENIIQLAELGFSGVLLIEKPLFDDVKPFPDNSFQRVHIAFNMRFHPLLSELKKAVAQREIFSIHAYVGQYLPDWRPGRDYRAGYSAIKAQGGGVLRDLSHELDMSTYIGGSAHNVTALGGKLSCLEIDSDDTFAILMRMARCPAASVNMNYLDTIPHREFVIHTDKGTLRADLIKGELSDGIDTRRILVERNESYSAMHRAIIDCDTRVICSLQEGEHIQTLIAAIEKAAFSEEWISIDAK